ncbi:L-2-hydroxyglutarate oxidase LhgO [Sphaerotilus hippei]|uniref:L-2-hydroxyglutarate oxidase LhgO n=1 Tax=Sphaerotilus hippei TaxID=744406 RepID=A0A318H6Z0_9BURK|nr:NAD(P)/FAD-dependent oxidoreductase [Sphaerotilus hippei]PXW95266.1 L-2-hydroxyglutarate oxidase LhgO [Sphaerotilus hippei]
MESVDCVVIGAGVIGLAVARALAMAGREVVILEAQDAIGTATSSRNSEVIHAGIYYPTGSLKAKFCVEGKGLLYDFCDSHQVTYQRPGKILVATDPSQHGKLEALARQAVANGVDDLRWLSADEARALEPELHCTAALLSPSTGILDSHGYMLALLGDAEAHGAMLALCSPVLSMERPDDGGPGLLLHVGGAEASQLRARTVINSAGLWAPVVASRVQGLAPELSPRAHFCKGSYFSYTGRAPFKHLIYPMPNSAGLGVHITLDLAGQMRFGPDTEWIDVEPIQPDGSPADFGARYVVDPARQAGMDESIRRYWPGLPDGSLAPAYSGIRPKISGPDDAAADFRIDGPARHGVPGLVQLFGIESPGLTSSLAIARHVQSLV